MRDWHLVQRMDLVDEGRMPNPFGGGMLGGIFELNYMGSFEFENGSVRESAQRIVELHDLVVVRRNVALKGLGEDVFFVVSKRKDLSSFDEWLAAGEPGKESAMFAEVFLALHGGADHHRSPEELALKAWWSLNNDVMWTLAEETAEKLAGVFEQAKTG